MTDMNHAHGNELCTLCWMRYPTKMNTQILFAAWVGYHKDNPKIVLYSRK